jgi:hypothetical protein
MLGDIRGPIKNKSHQTDHTHARAQKWVTIKASDEAELQRSLWQGLSWHPYEINGKAHMETKDKVPLNDEGNWHLANRLEIDIN